MGHIYDDERSPLALLTCRCIYAEAVNLLYSHPTLAIHCTVTVERLPRVMLPDRFSHIRTIQFSTAFTLSAPTMSNCGYLRSA
ncbi:hypothetical protein DIS24_g10544 [Lasiodiplodia hormozganensis]|uniref:DUF7730 domain-containing protein n=1 Tax=Lasiodiplodia hormozganensis TaxID=869390 RepID=A0AA39XRA4_9PEZI|nr:hypothetical protein DIS24_g10544 [Lasiodiplodia hormozganensis]